jgi:hypothetical protein
MAKAKKSEKSETKSEAKSAAKKAAPKPAAKKNAAAPTGPADAPMVDTNLAAQAAARMLAAGVHAKPAQQKPEASQPQAKNESALFKQLKAGLNKPAASTMGGLLDKSGGPIQKKPNQPFGGKQVGHNQTFGADVTRSGVPRRTSG